MNEAQEHLRKYLSVPAAERLGMVENNLARVVNEMLKEDPQPIGVQLLTQAVILDIVRELRFVKKHLGLKDAPEPKPIAEVEPQNPVVRVEQIPMDGMEP